MVKGPIVLGCTHGFRTQGFFLPLKLLSDWYLRLFRQIISPGDSKKLPNPNCQRPMRQRSNAASTPLEIGSWALGVGFGRYHRPLLRLVPIVGLVLTLTSLAGCSGSSRPSAADRLHPCVTDEGPTDALCGTLKVFENRQSHSGRQISLNIVVLPAIG